MENFNTSKKRDYIRTNADIRECLMARITALGMLLTDVEKDAAKLNRKSIRVSRLSAFFQETTDNYYDRNCLTQEDILWLCDRFGIDVKLTVQLKQNWKEESSLQLIRRKYGKEKG